MYPDKFGFWQIEPSPWVPPDSHLIMDEPHPFIQSLGRASFWGSQWQRLLSTRTSSEAMSLTVILSTIGLSCPRLCMFMWTPSFAPTLDQEYSIKTNEAPQVFVNHAYGSRISPSTIRLRLDYYVFKSAPGWSLGLQACEPSMSSYKNRK